MLGDGGILKRDAPSILDRRVPIPHGLARIHPPQSIVDPIESPSHTFESEVWPLRRALVRHPRDAFVMQEKIEREWRSLGYAAPPDLSAACREADDFFGLLTDLGVHLEFLPRVEGGTLDALYARDAAVVSDRGAVICRMGKEARRTEPQTHARMLTSLGVPVRAHVAAPGTLEGGDVAWLRPGSVMVGRGYRTNAAGARALADALGDDHRVTEVPLPHWNGPGEVLHLMSLVSPVADDLVLVYRRLLPVPFLEWLQDEGVRLIDVPDEEFDLQACNVLAVRPGVVVTLEGAPETRRRLETAGVEVHLYEGREISLKGTGGPTCLVRTLERTRPD